MTDKNKPDIQNSGISNEPETAIQNAVPTEDKTLLHSDALTNGATDEPTRKFTAPADELQTNHKTEFEAEPTKILQVESPDDISDEPPATPDENALRPSRLRFALVCLFFVIMFIYAGINLYQSFLIQSSLPFIAQRQGDGFVIASVRPGFEEAFQAGDELVSINGIEVKTSNVARLRLEYLRADAPGVRRTVIVRRGGQEREVETAYAALSLSFRLNRILLGFLSAAMFLGTGLLLFLLKPNDKQALLLALAFGSVVWGSPSISAVSPFLLVPLFIGFLLVPLNAPLGLHFTLVFPERSTLLRRFPKLEWLIYLPFLLFMLPYHLAEVFQFAGYSVPTNVSALAFSFDGFQYTYRLYHLTGLLALIFAYRRSSEIARRKLRVILVGLLCGLSPILLAVFVLNPLLETFAIRNPWQEWVTIIIFAPVLIIPPVFAYAIARHRVIPISFVIRRGLQYLLAKNALRLFLILPILGIIWNVAANPNRTLSEILLNNSFSFYFFVAVAVVDGILMRSRLSVWIDKKFFREQYNQERVLRELTGAVAESDSLPKLSRLVSNKIQSALHSENVYLFFRDDAMNSDFSLGYTPSETSDGSANLKLAADSPILRFMQRKREAIDFPFKEKGDLLNRESLWLRSINANLLVPMHGSDGKLAGFFSLGEKKSEIPYTGRDKELLETLAHQIALVHENLSLKDRVRREQRIKTEVLSRFDQADINLLKECPTCGRCYDRTTLKCADDNSNLTFTLPVERTIENRYRLEKLLGKGGMGAVYEATDTRINRRVAVKILSGAMFGNRDALRRFEREAQTAGKLNHRNIVTVFDYGVLSTEGAFLVMELVKGETLSEALKREGKLNAETVQAWFAQVLDGVEAAHKAGIIHRDLKPDHIFVTQDEEETVRLCILDFGLARFNELEFAENVTVPGTVMGTLGYMPPEQLRGEKVDARSDLFATGVIIYECLHGEKPFAGKTYREISQSMSEEITFDAPFADFFRRSLAREPENRFAGAGEMKKSLIS